MVGTMLLRGMLVGVLAALLSFGFLRAVGEPVVAKALVFEARMDEAHTKAEHDEAVARGLTPPVEAEEPELVSRPVQAGIGLATGVGVYSTAFGGLFALVFAVCFRRMGDFGARAAAALLAATGFVAVYLVPSLKYPANPPSVGLPETIGLRTQLYAAMIVLSLAAAVAAWVLRNRLLPRVGAWNAALLAVASYGVVVLLAALLLPGIDEVPDGFPATVLWQFRIASIGAQAIMWATLGLGFGAWMQRRVPTSQRVRAPV